MPEPSQKEVRETMEEIEDNKLFYQSQRYLSGFCYEDLLPDNVVEMRRKRVRRCG